MLLVTEREVRQLLDLDAAVAVLTAALADQAAGRASTLPRTTLAAAGGTAAARQVDARVADLAAAGVHGATVSSVGAGGTRPLALLFDRETGAPVAAVEAAPLVALAAVATTAVAAAAMAVPGADTVGVLGAGPQARNQLRAACHALPVASAVLWSPTPAHRDRAAADLAEELAIPVRVACHPDEAAAAPVVMVAARSAVPVLDGTWLRPGAHVSSVGADRPGKRELDGSAIRLADRLVADHAGQAAAMSGDLLAVAADGDDRRPEVAELADVVAGTVPGRADAAEITVFVSTGSGLAALALAAAAAAAAELARPDQG